MNQATINLTPEEMKKVEIIQERQGLPSREMAIRKMIELHSINASTR